ncbi:MAG: hypothetical protein ABIQ40_16765 [Bacteroidia bacterium]
MGLFNNPWGKGSDEHDRWFKNLWENSAKEFEGSSLVDNIKKLLISDLLDIGKGAEDLASSSKIMTHYWKFQKRNLGWFFSPNLNLLSATKKPSRFSSWDEWDKLTTNAKQTLSDLAEFDTSRSIIRNAFDLKKLLKAYTDWPKHLYSVFWAIPDGSDEETFTCNIFVGDAIYMAGKSITNSEKKYYSAKQIFNAADPFKIVQKKNVARGNIVAFGGTHLEIVTKVYADGEDQLFCSRGGGRSSQEEMGEEKCGEGTWWWSTDREINDDDIHFLTV